MLASFKSSKLLIARAKEHLDQFNHVQRQFVAKNPYTRLSEIDPKTGQQALKIKVGELPGKLSAIAFDIINCLRSALDHAVFDGARVVGGIPSPKYTKFPFGKDSEAASRDLDRYKDSEVPISLRPYFLAFEPYKGGKEALWELNELRNTKIHRILQGFAVASQDFGISNGYIKSMSFSLVSEWDDAKRELTFMRIAPGAQANINFSVGVSVILGDSTLLGRRPASEIFGKFIEVIERITLGIEAESSRIVREGNGS